MSTYVPPNDVINVRLEPWYERYLQAIETQIENICSKKSFIANGGKIRVLGIEGCADFGKRTRDEWTALIEDLDRGFRADTLHCRPSSSRVPLDELLEALEWSQKPHRHIIIASCPSQVGDNMNVMDQVKVMCGEYDNVSFGFSSAGNLASTLYANSTSPRGGGGAAEDLAAGVAAIAVSAPPPSRRDVEAANAVNGEGQTALWLASLAGTWPRSRRSWRAARASTGPARVAAPPSTSRRRRAT